MKEQFRWSPDGGGPTNAPRTRGEKRLGVGSKLCVKSAMSKSVFFNISQGTLIALTASILHFFCSHDPGYMTHSGAGHRRFGQRFWRGSFNLANTFEIATRTCPSWFAELRQNKNRAESPQYLWVSTNLQM